MTEAAQDPQRAIVVDAIVPPTKLEPPPLRPEHVSRATLVGRLAPTSLPALAVVAAPAGYGKSTLLGELARGTESGVVGWLSLDRDDADPARFWVAVASALQKVRPEAFADLGELARTGVDPDATIVPRLLSDASSLSSPFVLIIDDYHRLGRSEVHEQLSRVIEFSPRHLRIVVSTRADPPLRLARLRAAGELVEVRAADLRFSELEATAFLNEKLALGLTGRELAILLERAEGWAGALYLAALSIAHRSDRSAFIESFAGTSRFVVDYLGDEVLSGLPDDERDFLLRCSVLGSLTGSLVDEVLERRGSASLLRELVRSNMLVVPLDDHGTWFRLHHLFSDLLRAELLEANPDLVPELHIRASRWFAANDFMDAAIEHALFAEDVDEAGRLVFACYWTYLQRGQVATVHRWLDRLGDEVVSADPRLCIVAAWACGYRGQPVEVESWLARAAEADGHGEELPGGQGTIESASATLRAGFGYGDVGARVQAGRAAVREEYADAMWSWIADGSLGVALYWAGEPVEARLRVERTEQRLAGSSLPMLRAVALAYLCLIALEDGREDDASDAVTRAFALVRSNGLAEETDAGLVHLARGKVTARAGNIAAARADFEDAVLRLERGSNVLETALAHVELADLLERVGEREQAQFVLEDVSATLAAFSDSGILAGRLAAARHRVGLVEVPKLPADDRCGLTGRELEVLMYLPGPLSQREIAAALWVSFNTVTSHIRSIYRKLGVSSRAQAVERSQELGIL